MSKNVEKIKKTLEQMASFSHLFEETRTFTEQLLEENDRLRNSVHQLQSQVQTLENQSQANPSADVIEEHERLQKEMNELKASILEIEAENREFAEKYVSIEQQSNNLASLYVASYRLHSTLQFSNVVEIVREIVLNLLGSEHFTVCLRDEEDKLKVIAQEASPYKINDTIRKDDSLLWKVVTSGEDYFINKAESPDPDMQACVALKVHDEVTGVLAIHKFFAHKSGMTEIDFELCALLASHAATAIYSAQLFESVTRKLETYKNLMDLLKNQTVQES